MRLKPYTEIGLRRVKCVRCRKPATSQWQACADGRVYRPMCTECDIKVNEIVLMFMRDPDTKQKIEAYRQQKQDE